MVRRLLLGWRLLRLWLLLLRHLLLTQLLLTRLELGRLGLALQRTLLLLLRPRTLLRTLLLRNLARRHRTLRKLRLLAHLGGRDLLLQGLLAHVVGRVGHAVGQHLTGELGEALVLVHAVRALEAAGLLGATLRSTRLLGAGLGRTGTERAGRTRGNGSAVGHGASDLSRLGGLALRNLRILLALETRALLILRNKLVRRRPLQLHARPHGTTGQRTTKAGIGGVGVLVATDAAIAQRAGRCMTWRVLRSTRRRTLGVVYATAAAATATSTVLGAATSDTAHDTAHAAAEAAKEFLGALHFLFGARYLARVIGGRDLLVARRKRHALLARLAELTVVLELLLLLLTVLARRLRRRTLELAT